MKQLQSISESHFFKRIVAVVIVLCSILLGVETFFPNEASLFQSLDLGFTIFFIFEIIIRIGADGGRLKFFHLFSFVKNEQGRFHLHVHEHGFWNWFDFTIVLASVISLFSDLFSHPEFLEVARLFRVMRVLRLLEISKELIAVERRIVSIIPTVFSFVALLGVLLFIYAIIGVFIFNHNQYSHADFTSLSHAFLTLFQLMTLDNWSDLMYASCEEYGGSWFIKSYFISFILLTAIISFNVFVAVLTSQVQEKMMVERENKADSASAKTTNSNDINLLLNEIKLLRQEVQSLQLKR